MMVDVVQTLTHYSADLATLDLSHFNPSHFTISHLGDSIQSLHLHLPALPDDWTGVAQQFKEPDFAGDVGKAWGRFVKTGQVWAFLIGIIFGYLIKTFTSFG
ncbi:hypothetical protein [Alkalinema sp. FACHB-956]|uniref:hypothetical protein n=1 Tax=Alkalinema sp. FACHB-956 TaxID=2692768 RepID=UPI001686029A|nr:hypothetical protein [Alkalinema sp. FACHB-956]MBD2328529.1 hypothetical protein [Alkalinema sp. FACHB-956]